MQAVVQKNASKLPGAIALRVVDLLVFESLHICRHFPQSP
jgi:hypothetical protein